MDKSRFIFRSIIRSQPSKFISTTLRPDTQQPWTCTQCLRRRRWPANPFTSLRQQRRQKSTPADEPGFTSVVDNPPILVRSGRRHNRWGLVVLATIPITSFILGCWQVQRLGWKTDLIAKFEDRLVRDPLPLPPHIDPDAVKDFDYRRVYARGKFRHDQEMLIGPRIHDGEDGYLVITPLDRNEDFSESEKNTTILVNRGWIPKNKAAQSTRPDSITTAAVIISGLLREPWKKNSFTPSNDPSKNAWYFPDVHQMAEHVGSQPVWIEETMQSDLLTAYDRQARGIPIGRPAEVNLRNNHTQYIFTWFSLCAATSVMLAMVVRRPGRMRQNRAW